MDRSIRPAATAPLVFVAIALAGMESVSRAQATVPPSRTSSSRGLRIPRVREVPADYRTIQGAIRASQDGDVVRVQRGTYEEHIDFLGKAIEVVGNDGAGGTILAPLTDGAVVRFHSGEGPDSLLAGFTIRGGTADPGSSAGGVSAVDPGTGLASRPTLADCVIEDGRRNPFSIGAAPGGLRGDALLERCILRGNLSSFQPAAGGAQGRLTLVQCVIEDDEGSGAGGLWLEPGSHVLDCVLRGNRASTGAAFTAGGGIRIGGPGVVVEGSVLLDNVVHEDSDGGGFGECVGGSRGGALYGEALLERCTIAGNRWESCASIGGVEGSPTLRDCIVYGNADPLGFYAAWTSMRYTDVQGGAAGAGSFDRFPVLVDPGRGDVHLGPSSPCVDRGDPASPKDPDGTRADVGAIYRPQGHALLGVAWREELPIVAPDAEALPSFGDSVAASDETLLVGSSSAGVSVLRRQGSGWSEIQRLEPDAIEDGFGRSVALAGDIAAIAGGLGYFGAGEDAVRVYERPSVDAPFEETASIPGPVLGFGTSVALDGNLLVVGADIGITPGRAFVYRRRARGRWMEVARLSAPEEQSWLYSQFGAVVDVDGDTIVVGAPHFGDSETYFGAVYVYERAGASPFSWVLSRTLHPSSPEPNTRFGQSLSLEGNTLLVGQTNGATVFERGGPGLPWHEAQRLAPSALVPGFGSNVLLQGDRLWITRPAQTFPQASPTCAVWEFSRENAGAPWFEAARIGLANGAFASDRTNALAASQGSLFLGSASTDTGARAVRRLTRGPSVASVQLDQAADAEPIKINGERLNEVTEVRVGGVRQVIFARNPLELTIRVARRDPGFADLTLVSASGPLVLPGAFESLPSLRAQSSGSGGVLHVRIENGEAGAFVLAWSLFLLSTPAPLGEPPTWFALQLAPPVENLATEAIPSSGRAELDFQLPSVPALVGVPFYLQAWCQRGFFGTVKYSFSNTATASF